MAYDKVWLAKSDERVKEAYDATAPVLDQLIKDFPALSEILAAFGSGTLKVELRKRYMLKMIDEVWVRVVEDTFPALDTIMRAPGFLLQEVEEILPIELTRKITSRTVQHLSQHTDYINEIREDGTVVPSKVLNVFQDETPLTYENKFINTLLNRLYAFVCVRYDKAKECGEDEKNTILKISQEFRGDEMHGKMSLEIEVSEPPREHEVVKNYIYTSDLWRRVERIKKIVSAYMGSSFVALIGRNYVRPPIMRTNKLLKNPNFRQCLSLWEFLESYENTGYETLIQESLENVPEQCLIDLCNTLAEQYLVFRKHIENGFDGDNTLDSRTEGVIHPEIKEEFDPFNERDYDYRDLVPEKKPDDIMLTGMEDDIDEAIRIALAADNFNFAEEAEDDRGEVTDEGIKYKYRYSFLARLILAQNPTQNFYTEIKNELLSYKKVKSRISWNYESFNAGRKKCARINVKGKTIYLYLPLNPNDYIDTKYHFVDVSEKNEELPFLLKVRSERGVKYAKELIADVMALLGLERLENPEYVDYHMPYQTPDEMARLNPPLVKLLDGTIPEPLPEEDTQEEQTPDLNLEEAAGINYKYRYSFQARLILAQNPTQNYYSEVKNELLSYEKVKSRIGWSHESFNAGRKKCARINVKGKTVYLYLPLSSAEMESKYHLVDLSEKNSEFPSLLKVRSDRGVKYAKELIAIVMAGYELNRLDNPEYVDYHMPYQTPEEMARRNPPLVKVLDGSIVPDELPPEDTATEAPVEEIAVPDVDFEETEVDTEGEDGDATDEQGEFGFGLTLPVPEAENNSVQYKYRYSFLARVVVAQDPVQDYYTEVKNELLSYKKVKSRLSWTHESFNAGRKKCARINVKGKTVYLYLPLSSAEMESKYHLVDLSEKNSEFPSLLKVRSDRGVKYAKELIAIVMAGHELDRLDNPEYVDYHMPYQTPDEMARLNPPLVKYIDGTIPEPLPEVAVEPETEVETAQEVAFKPETEVAVEPETVLPIVALEEEVNYKYRYSFLARLIQAEESMQVSYSEIKNYILSFEKVKNKTVWGYESFRLGRKTFLKMKVRGKSLALYLALDPKEVDAKYHVKDLTRADGTVPELATLLKVRSSRSVKYAKELILAIMQTLEAVQGDIPDVDYRMPYQTTEEMLALDEPLVKSVMPGEANSNVGGLSKTPDDEACSEVEDGDEAYSEGDDDDDAE